MTMSNTRRRRENRKAYEAAGYTGVIPGAVTVCRSSEVVKNGERIIVVHFEPGADMPRHDVKLVGLDPSLPFAPVLRAAFEVTACRQKAISSRRSVWSHIRSGLLKFLNESDKVSPIFDDNLVARFVHWLNRYDDGKPAYALYTRRNYFKTAMDLLHTGADNATVGLKGVKIDWRWNPWAGEKAAPPREKAFLSPKDMTTILRAARSEIEAKMAEVGEDLNDLAAGRFQNPVAAEAGRLGRLVSTSCANEVVKDLSILERLSIPDAIGTSAIRLLTPTIADLMPFIVTLAHYTGFNPSTILAMLKGDVRHRNRGSARYTIIESYKRRSGSVQRAVFAVDDSLTNPAHLLDFVMNWTDSLRSWMRSDHVWLVCTNDEVRDLGDPLAPNMLPSALNTWLPRFNLPHASLTGIRKGILDLAHLASNGDEAAVREIGGQKSSDVIENHYTSPAARKRERERLAWADLEAGRFIRSNGKVDARLLPDTFDRSAATPGFSCLDRFSSPMPGEKPGRPCQAYGHCAICVHGIVDISSPRSCGYLHLLLDRVLAGLIGKGAGPTKEYIAAWGPVATHLRDRWLPLFDGATRAAAKQLELPPLPEIE